MKNFRRLSKEEIAELCHPSPLPREQAYDVNFLGEIDEKEGPIARVDYLVMISNHIFTDSILPCRPYRKGEMYFRKLHVDCGNQEAWRALAQMEAEADTEGEEEDPWIHPL